MDTSKTVRPSFKRQLAEVTRQHVQLMLLGGVSEATITRTLGQWVRIESAA